MKITRTMAIAYILTLITIIVACIPVLIPKMQLWDSEQFGMMVSALALITCMFTVIDAYRAADTLLMVASLMMICLGALYWQIQIQRQKYIERYSSADQKSALFHFLATFAILMPSFTTQPACFLTSKNKTLKSTDYSRMRLNASKMAWL